MAPENVAIRASDPALDPRVLAELANMQRNGRPGFMDRLITLYLQTAAELIAELEAASGLDSSTLHLSLGVRQNLAVLGCDDCSQAALVTLQQLAEAIQNPGAPQGRKGSPLWERGGCGFHGEVDLSFAGKSDPSSRFPE